MVARLAARVPYKPNAEVAGHRIVVNSWVKRQWFGVLEESAERRESITKKEAILRENEDSIFLVTFFDFLVIVCRCFWWGSIIIKLLICISMCFLKTLKPLDTIPIEKGHLPVDTPTCQNYNHLKTTQAFPKIIERPALGFSLSNQDQLLLNLLNLVNSNTQLLHDVDQKLSYNDQTLNNAFDQLDSAFDQSCDPKQDSEQTELIRHPSMADELTPADPLVQTLFGKKRYQYRLELQEEVPATIYKERNLNISVVLKNKQNQKVLNSNIIHLCLGVCDAEGEWITENKAKENFMKGKTEVEMYHGEGSFLKVYPREVSRTYAGGKLNFVVYSKPSMLKFSSNSSSLEKIIDSGLIEPLVIKDISVKAKKKE